MSTQPLENQKHERFAQAILAGENGTKAYLKAYPSTSYDAARANAPKLLAKTCIQERIEALQRKLTEQTVLTLARKRAILREISEGERPSKLVKLPGGKQIKTFEPVKAIELDAKLAGELDTRPDQAGTVNVTLVNLSLTGDLPKLVSESDTKPVIPV